MSLATCLVEFWGHYMARHTPSLLSQFEEPRLHEVKWHIKPETVVKHIDTFQGLRDWVVLG